MKQYRNSIYNSMTKAGRRDHDSIGQIKLALSIRAARIIKSAEQAFPLAAEEISELLYPPAIWEATKNYIEMMECAYPQADVAVGAKSNTVALLHQNATPTERSAIIFFQCNPPIRTPVSQEMYIFNDQRLPIERRGAFALYFRSPAMAAAFGRWVAGAVQARRRAAFINHVYDKVVRWYNTPASLKKVWPEIVPHGTPMGRCGALAPQPLALRQQIDGANAMLALEALIPRTLEDTPATVQSWSKLDNDIV